MKTFIVFCWYNHLGILAVSTKARLTYMLRDSNYTPWHIPNINVYIYSQKDICKSICDSMTCNNLTMATTQRTISI